MRLDSCSTAPTGVGERASRRRKVIRKHEREQNLGDVHLPIVKERQVTEGVSVVSREKVTKANYCLEACVTNS